jgi:hypothetical protein
MLPQERLASEKVCHLEAELFCFFLPHSNLPPKTTKQNEEKIVKGLGRKEREEKNSETTSR